jgi:hypothetical protein
MGAAGAIEGALASRMITIQIPKSRSYGVLDTVPAGFPNARAAMEFLRAGVDEDYGWGGPCFIKRLVKAAAVDEDALRRTIKRLMNRYLKKFRKGNAQGGSARIEKVFAITFAAGMLARKWGILPKAWGLSIHRTLNDGQRPRSSPSALDHINAYVEKNRDRLLEVRKVKAPYSPEDFQTAAGFLRRRDGYDEILIPSKQFQKTFRNHHDLMRSLKQAGRTHTEGGAKPKLTIKAPKKLCAGAHVYCILLESDHTR